MFQKIKHWINYDQQLYTLAYNIMFLQEFNVYVRKKVNDYALWLCTGAGEKADSLPCELLRTDG